MRTRVAVVVLVAACAGYLILSAQRVAEFLRTGSLVGQFFAASIAAVSLITAGLIAREVLFGRTIARMNRALDEAGMAPATDLPRTPSGRVTAEAAEQQFQIAKQRVEADETAWQNWYLLAVAYDDARDRKRARAAMRTAERLFRAA